MLLPTLVPCVHVSTALQIQAPCFRGMAIRRANPQDVQEGVFYEKVFGSISPSFEFELSGVRAKHRTANEG